MRVWIDQTELQSATNLDEALELARVHSEQSGRLIIDILADGKPLDESMLESNKQPDAISELRLTTTDPGAFLSETLHTARETLTLIREDQGTAADHLRTGQLEAAVEALTAVLQGWQAVRDVVDQSAELAGIDVTTMSFAGTTGSACIERLGVTLREIRDALAKQDWSTLGDSIEYDLDEQAEHWDTLMSAMSDRVQDEKHRS